ncbi:ABC transporter ATP-binding protein [Dactylosporangium sp. NPDC048998]|uniref:ABC transporter ATP-binding protein n=1 Tax=Dactylosporangium sp. NPDC048998 TaxID=3363976 RepID=UPI0037151E12
MKIGTASQRVLELLDVTFRRDAKEILHGVSFTVARGEHWVMLGPNGAGKSTILGFCGAVVHPTSGAVHVLGHQLGRVELQALRRHIGHVNPRHPLRSPLTVTEIVLTGITGTIETPMRWQPNREELARAHHLIDLLGLANQADDLWPTLSQGERGRTLIARALAPDPLLLLLDEPSTGLDLAAREQLLDTIDLLCHTHPDLTSILVTHHLEELPETTTHALLLADGRIVAAGPTSEVLTSENVTTAFDYPVEVEHRDGRWIARTAKSRTKHRQGDRQ